MLGRSYYSVEFQWTQIVGRNYYIVGFQCTQIGFLNSQLLLSTLAFTVMQPPPHASHTLKLTPRVLFLEWYNVLEFRSGSPSLHSAQTLTSWRIGCYICIHTCGNCWYRLFAFSSLETWLLSTETTILNCLLWWTKREMEKPAMVYLAQFIMLFKVKLALLQCSQGSYFS